MGENSKLIRKNNISIYKNTVKMLGFGILIIFFDLQNNFKILMSKIE